MPTTKKTIITLTIITTLITLTTPYKTGENCLLTSLNPSDPSLHHLSDYTNLTNSVLDFPLLPKALQTLYKACQVNKDLKQKCDAFHYPDQCEECGMIYVKKCPKDFIRLDCGLCARKCPEKTVSDAAGALCRKPAVLKRRVFKTVFDCKREGEGCEEFEGFVVGGCEQGFRGLGRFLCGFECPAEFREKGIYCVPDLVEDNAYFMSDFQESGKEEKVREY